MDGQWMQFLKKKTKHYVHILFTIILSQKQRVGVFICEILYELKVFWEMF